jgi:molybdate-binding protein
MMQMTVSQQIASTAGTENASIDKESYDRLVAKCNMMMDLMMQIVERIDVYEKKREEEQNDDEDDDDY